jgi:acyl dehydratase
MPIDYAKLVPGQSISERSYVLDADAVSRYVAAVGDRTWTASAGDGPRLAPPMAVAALSLRGVVVDLEIPGGTLHAGQEFEFSAAVPLGWRLACTATLEQNSVRGEWRFLVVRVSVRNDDGVAVMEGKSTLMLPA